jgi:L-lactate dehydrogenase (cytochrome)/(S)-mandelate dehydrogenase
MAQMGATKIADLGPHYLMWKDEEDLRRNRR